MHVHACPWHQIMQPGYVHSHICDERTQTRIHAHADTHADVHARHVLPTPPVI